MQLIKQLKIPIRLKLILIVVLMLIATSFTVTAQMPSAGSSAETLRASSGERLTIADDCTDNLRIAEQRLLKTLDALDQAKQLILFKDQEIEARKRVDAVNNELLKIKDLIISEQSKLIDVLQKKKNSAWGKIKKLLEMVEKIALIAIGIYVGKGL